MFVSLPLFCTRRTPKDIKSQAYVVDPVGWVDLNAPGVHGTGQKVGHDRRSVVVGREYHLKIE